MSANAQVATSGRVRSFPAEHGINYVDFLFLSLSPSHCNCNCKFG